MKKEINKCNFELFRKDANTIAIKGIKTSKDLFCLKMANNVGIVPNDIPKDSILFIDPNQEVKIGDYVIVKTEEKGYTNGMRLKKVMSDEEGNILGKLILTVKDFT